MKVSEGEDETYRTLEEKLHHVRPNVTYFY